jgi:hypothetical protein
MKRMLALLLIVTMFGIVGCEIEDDALDVRLGDEPETVEVSVD